MRKFEDTHTWWLKSVKLLNKIFRGRSSHGRARQCPLPRQREGKNFLYPYGNFPSRKSREMIQKRLSRKFTGITRGGRNSARFQQDFSKIFKVRVRLNRSQNKLYKARVHIDAINKFKIVENIFVAFFVNN